MVSDTWHRYTSCIGAVVYFLQWHLGFFHESVGLWWSRCGNTGYAVILDVEECLVINMAMVCLYTCGGGLLLVLDARLAVGDNQYIGKFIGWWLYGGGSYINNCWINIVSSNVITNYELFMVMFVQ